MAIIQFLTVDSVTTFSSSQVLHQPNRLKNGFLDYCQQQTTFQVGGRSKSSREAEGSRAWSQSSGEAEKYEFSLDINNILDLAQL